MPPKRKEDKKQEEDIDLSTLPPWISIFTMIEWESSLSEVASLFPIYQFTLITRSDLLAYSKEKGYINQTITESTIPTQTLAKALSEKVSFLDLQGRKSKRDQLQRLESPDKLRPESRQTSQLLTESAPTVSPMLFPQKPDKIYILLNFPRTLEEITVSARYGINIQFFYYIRPDPIHSTSQFLPNFKEALQRSEKNSPLRTFIDKTVIYDLNKYQGMETELAKLEETKLDKAESVVSAETEKQLRSSKTMKKAVKEMRDEIATPQLPDLRKLFIAELVKLILDLGTVFVKYLAWKENLPCRPLFPSGVVQEGLETTSNTTVSYSGEFGRPWLDLPSLDDAAKPWDFRVFHYLFDKVRDKNSTTEYFLACIMQQIEFSQRYLSDCNLPEVTEASLVLGNDFLKLPYPNLAFITGPVSEFLYKLYENFNFPINFKGEQNISTDKANYFFSNERNELRWLIMLTRFEELISSRTGKKVEIQREFGERLEKVVLSATIQKILKYSPEIIFCKHDGATLLGFFYDSSGVSTNSWEHTKKIRPNFQDWKEFNMYPTEFYDIDELKIGVVNNQETLLYPNNGGMLKSVKYSVAQKSLKRCVGLIRDWVFGVHDSGKEVFAVLQDFRITADEESVSLTHNGLVLVCSLTEVLQELSESRMEFRLQLGGKKEKNRVVTGKGSVIRYLDNGHIQILFANGNISDYDGKWKATNNKGIRFCKGESLNSVPCASITDPHTGQRTTFREDGTFVFEYSQGTVVEFADGTKIFSGISEFVVESPGYAAVRIEKKSLEYKVIVNEMSFVQKCGEKIEVSLRNQQEKAVFESGCLKVDEFELDVKNSSIMCKDGLGNFYSIGMFQEPKQVIVRKIEEFNNLCRLFVVEESGDGMEILDKSQVLSTIFIKGTKFECSVDSKNFEVVYKGENDTAVEKGHIEDSFLEEYSYSASFEKIKPGPEKLKSDPVTRFSYRYFEKYQRLTEEQRVSFKEQYSKYIQWQSKQVAGKEFGLSEFSPVSFQINRNSIYERIKARSQQHLPRTNIPSFIENLVKDQLYSSKHSEKNVNTQHSEPNLCDSPVHKIKSKKTTTYSGSIPSTMHSFNYFKSPEGLDFSLIYQSTNQSIIPKPSPVLPAKIPQKDSQKPAEDSQDSQKTLQDTYEENPFVSLIPTKGKKVILKPVQKPSVYSQLESLQKMKESSEKTVADEYHLAKNMNFDLVGGLRKSLPNVSALRSTSPASSKINLKYLNSEILTETKVRTISQTRRSIFKQPNVSTYRRESGHMLSKSVLMNDYLTDPLRRLLEITPNVANFGNVLVGQVSSMKLIVKNEDCTLVRFVVRQPNVAWAKVVYRPAPIAPGMISKFIVEVSCKEVGKVSGEFEVLCKSEIYMIPILVNVVSDEGMVSKRENISLAEKVRERRLPALNRSIA